MILAVLSHCRQVKVYSMQDYRVVHSMSYPAPILSMAMSVSQCHFCKTTIIVACSVQPTDSHFVVGMSTKLLNIKARLPKQLSSVPSPYTATPRGGSYRYFVRGKTYKPIAVSTYQVCSSAIFTSCVALKEEYVVTVPKMSRLKPYEKLLKKFEYRKALFAALQVSALFLLH